MQNPIDSYECVTCGKCYNGQSETESDHLRRFCDHKADSMISRKVYERHMQYLTANSLI